MVAWLDKLIKNRDDEARENHANWDRALFQRLCQDLLKPLCQNVKKPDPKMAESYLNLLREALLCSYLTSWDPYGNNAKTVLQYCLTVLIPKLLPQYDAEQRCSMMVRLWNIGEGFYQEPPWLNQYVLSRLPELAELSQFESFIQDLLDPVLKPISKSDWRGPFKVTRINTRCVDDEFLPGAMRLTAPSVLLVKDREREAQLTLLLQKEGKSQILDSSRQDTEYIEEFDRPKMQFRLGTLSIESELIELPQLDVKEDSFMTESGFVVLSAVDSQLLWIVESP